MSPVCENNGFFVKSSPLPRPRAAVAEGASICLAEATSEERALFTTSLLSLSCIQETGIRFTDKESENQLSIIRTLGVPGTKRVETGWL